MKLILVAILYIGLFSKHSHSDPVLKEPISSSESLDKSDKPGMGFIMQGILSNQPQQTPAVELVKENVPVVELQKDTDPELQPGYIASMIQKWAKALKEKEKSDSNVHVNLNENSKEISKEISKENQVHQEEKESEKLKSQKDSVQEDNDGILSLLSSFFPSEQVDSNEKKESKSMEKNENSFFENLKHFLSISEEDKEDKEKDKVQEAKETQEEGSLNDFIVKLTQKMTQSSPSPSTQESVKEQSYPEQEQEQEQETKDYMSTFTSLFSESSSKEEQVNDKKSETIDFSWFFDVLNQPSVKDTNSEQIIKVESASEKQVETEKKDPKVKDTDHDVPELSEFVSSLFRNVLKSKENPNGDSFILDSLFRKESSPSTLPNEDQVEQQKEKESKDIWNGFSIFKSLLADGSEREQQQQQEDLEPGYIWKSISSFLKSSSSSSESISKDTQEQVNVNIFKEIQDYFETLYSQNSNSQVQNAFQSLFTSSSVESDPNETSSVDLSRFKQFFSNLFGSEYSFKDVTSSFQSLLSSQSNEKQVETEKLNNFFQIWESSSSSASVDIFSFIKSLLPEEDVLIEKKTFITSDETNQDSFSFDKLDSLFDAFKDVNSPSKESKESESKELNYKSTCKNGFIGVDESWNGYCNKKCKSGNCNSKVCVCKDTLPLKNSVICADNRYKALQNHFNCQISCTLPPYNCPSTHCGCENEGMETNQRCPSPIQCIDSVYLALPGTLATDKWCQSVCNNKDDQGFCPCSLCTCQSKEKEFIDKLN